MHHARAHGRNPRHDFCAYMVNTGNCDLVRAPVILKRKINLFKLNEMTHDVPLNHWQGTLTSLQKLLKHIAYSAHSLWNFKFVRKGHSITGHRNIVVEILGFSFGCFGYDYFPTARRLFYIQFCCSHTIGRHLYACRKFVVMQKRAYADITSTVLVVVAEKR